MEVEKKRSKGGFLSLFDWNGKSRKRLFPNGNEVPGLNQGKENVENLSKAQLYQIESDENTATSSHKLNEEWDFSLTKTSDERCGGRVPSVVARLMGLDSLPSNVHEPSSTSFSETASLGASYHDTCNGLWNYHSDYIDMPNKLERFSGNLLDFRAQRVQKNPIERFQTEVLPPKSAKSIPITHHKLLSPIKSPGFTPTMNAGYLMEAANKIIEASPRKVVKSKMTSGAHSSVPIRIRDLKEKMETARSTSGIEKPTENCMGYYRKGKPGDRSCSGSENLLGSRVSTGAYKSNSNHLKDKGKPVSLAVQAKVNLHSGEHLTSCGDRISMDPKERNESKSNQLIKSQPSMQKTVQKRTIKRNNNVLGPNNQKQNSLANTDKLPLKPSDSKRLVKKSQSANGYVGPNKIVNKVVLNSGTESRVPRARLSDSKKEFVSSQRNNASQKKRPVNQEINCEASSASNALIHNGEKSVKYNVAVDSSTNCDENKKVGMDIVSFTFTSPLKKSISEPRSNEVVRVKQSLVFDSCGENDYLKNLSSLSHDLNVIDGDALSVLLEQKLQELTSRVESSNSNLSRESIFACSASNSQSAKREDEINSRNDDSDCPCDFECLSANSNVISANQLSQGVEETQELNDDEADSATIMESSIDDESFPDDRNSIQGDSYSSVQLMSNSASQIAVRDKEFCSSNTHRSDDWELQYVRDILSKAEPAFEDYTLGIASMAISPSLYNNLETQQNLKNDDEPEYLGLERKVLFDCVNECLELEFKQIVVSNSRTWGGWERSFHRGCLAEELHKEIQGWKSMEDWMVDELVDKDMSTQYGKWLNFDHETSEEGMEIQKGILTFLLDELVFDLLISV